VGNAGLDELRPRGFEAETPIKTGGMNLRIQAHRRMAAAARVFHQS